MAVLLVLLLLLWTPVAQAATYYMSPTGSNGNAGTSTGAPWKTFAFAGAQLFPGDTLNLLDGNYTEGTSGHVDFHCDTGAIRSGTAANRITIKSLNERKGHIISNGANPGPFALWGCNYWTVEGLHIEGGDFSSQSDGSIMILRGLDNDTPAQSLIIRRNLLQKNNRWINNSGMGMRIANSLVEENEMYYFHRHGFQLLSGDNNIFRRNYTNSRSYPDITSSANSAYFCFQEGDGAYALYGTPGVNNTILENNISDSDCIGVLIEATYAQMADTRIYGHIAYNAMRAVISSAQGFGTGADNLYMENFVHIGRQATVNGNWSELGFEMWSGSFTMKNVTVHGSPNMSEGSILTFVSSGEPGTPPYSFTGQNLLLLNNPSFGVHIQSSMTNWTINSVNAFGNGTNYSPSSSGNYTNKLTTAANLGTCKVWIPDGTPMKGIGVGGADIGANIVFRYQNGVLTTTPLWDQTTGQFPCGATVAGVNDTAGNSCINVHQRLNVNTNGCAFPSGSGGSGGPPPTPVPVVGTYYVSATTGDDGRSCTTAQTLSTPKLTLGNTIPCAGGGSTIYLRGGTYTEKIDTLSLPILGGASWATPTTIASYTGETATLRLPATGEPILAWFHNPTTDRYIVLDRLVLDGNSVAVSNALVLYPGVDHIRFQNGTIQGVTYERVLINGANQIDILQSVLTGGSVSPAISIGGSTGSTLQGNTILSAPIGIGPWAGLSNTGTLIAQNRIRNNTGFGIILKEGSAELVRNNLIYSNGAGLNIQTGSTGAKIYNNDFWSNTGVGIQVDSGVTTAGLINNILYQNGSTIVNNGTSTTQTTNQTTDPSFTNTALGDFTLPPTSTAVDTGTALAADVPLAFDGTVRPVPPGGGWDKGAYETEAPPSPVVPGPIPRGWPNAGFFFR